MTDDRSQQKDQGLSSLSVDPDLLARELAAEDDVDPLDAIQLDDAEQDSSLEIARACDQGLVLLRGVYALGRNPSPPAVEPLLQLLQLDANAYVRKAAAWSLGNFPDAPVLNPLIRALQTDVAAVRLWCPGSLAEAGSRSPVKADPAAGQLLVSLRIDSEAVVRSNCIWALGRLMDQLVQPRQAEIVEALVSALLHDGEISVRDEARTALEQLEDPLVLERLQALINDGFIL